MSATATTTTVAVTIAIAAVIMLRQDMDEGTPLMREKVGELLAEADPLASIAVVEAEEAFNVHICIHHHRSRRMHCNQKMNCTV